MVHLATREFDWLLKPGKGLVWDCNIVTVTTNGALFLVGHSITVGFLVTKELTC